MPTNTKSKRELIEEAAARDSAGGERASPEGERSDPLALGAGRGGRLPSSRSESVVRGLLVARSDSRASTPRSHGHIVDRTVPPPTDVSQGDQPPSRSIFP